MNLGRFGLTTIILYLAAILQQAAAPRWSIFGATPDFFVVGLSVLSLFASPSTGMVTGFFFGLVQGCLPTANVTHYVVSRTLAGYGIAKANSLRLNPSLGLAFGTAAVATLVAQVIWMFIAAPPDIGGFLGDTIVSAMYNGVLAMPLYALLKRILGSPLH